jgi:hypothetical protein
MMKNDHLTNLAYVEGFILFFINDPDRFFQHFIATHRNSLYAGNIGVTYLMNPNYLHPLTDA